jgi:hypothetical protein
MFSCENMEMAFSFVMDEVPSIIVSKNSFSASRAALSASSFSSSTIFLVLLLDAARSARSTVRGWINYSTLNKKQCMYGIKHSVPFALNCPLQR